MLDKSKLQSTPLQKACEGFALELIADVSPDTPGKSVKSGLSTTAASMQHGCWLLCKVLTMSSFAPSIPSSEGISSAVVSARRSGELVGGQEWGGSVLPSRARPTVGGTRTTCQSVLPGPGRCGAAPWPETWPATRGAARIARVNRNMQCCRARGVRTRSGDTEDGNSGLPHAAPS